MGRVTGYRIVRSEAFEALDAFADDDLAALERAVEVIGVAVDTINDMVDNGAVVDGLCDALCFLSDEERMLDAYLVGRHESWDEDGDE